VETLVTDSKQAILDAAEHIIARDGYAGLSMRELSKQSGLAKSTLYHYFADKHEIYLSVLERDMEIHRTQLCAAAAEPGNALDRMERMIRVYIDLLNKRGSVALNALRRTELEGDLIDMFRRNRPLIIAPIANVIQQGIDEGAFRAVDVELTVMSLFSMMNGFVAQRLLFECDTVGEATLESEMIEHTLDLFLNGIRTHR
jgi:AcrR family transcriptional regulator